MLTSPTVHILRWDLQPRPNPTNGHITPGPLFLSLHDSLYRRCPWRSALSDIASSSHASDAGKHIAKVCILHNMEEEEEEHRSAVAEEEEQCCASGSSGQRGSCITSSSHCPLLAASSASAVQTLPYLVLSASTLCSLPMLFTSFQFFAEKPFHISQHYRIQSSPLHSTALLLLPLHYDAPLLLPCYVGRRLLLYVCRHQTHGWMMP